MARSERLAPWLFLAPALLLLLVWRYFPIVWGLRESFYTNALSFSGGREFVGLDNFRWLLDDPTFWKSLEVTMIFNVIVNPLQTILAFFLALFINRSIRGIGAFRTILLLPIAISINISALAWGLALNAEYGLVNGMLEAIGLERQLFLRSVDQAMPTMIGIVSWIGVPLWALFFLAGLQNIPADVIEAARLDGATRFQTLYQIVLPLMRRVLAFVLVSTTVANLTLFAPPYLLTRGGPQESTNLLLYEAWQRGFVYSDLGASAAMTMVLLAITAIVVVIEFAFLRPAD